MYAMRPVDQAVVIILFHPAVTNAILRFISIPCCVSRLQRSSSAAFLVCRVSHPLHYSSTAFLIPVRIAAFCKSTESKSFTNSVAFPRKKLHTRASIFCKKDEILQKSECFFKSPAYENIVWTRTMYRIVPEAMEISMLRFHRKVTVTTAIAAASGIPKVPPEENETFRRQ